LAGVDDNERALGVADPDSVDGRESNLHPLRFDGHGHRDALLAWAGLVTAGSRVGQLIAPVEIPGPGNLTGATGHTVREAAPHHQPTEVSMSSSTDASSKASTRVPEAATMEMRLEVVVLPVSDVDRAKGFYQRRSDGGWTPTSPPVTTSGWCS
jgi:hypothetical protein